MFKVCLIENEKTISRGIHPFLSTYPEFEIQVVSNLQKATSIVDAHLDFAILSIEQFSLGSLEYFKQLKPAVKNLPILVVSPDKNHESMEAFIEEGAFDYMISDDFIELKLRLALKKVQRQVMYNREFQSMCNFKFALKEYNFAGNSFEAERIKILVSQAQASASPVLIVGEMGTGKEKIARSIHAGINWRNKPFVVVNTALLSSEALESEIFGCELNPRVQTDIPKMGALEEAGSGTLYINDIEHVSSKVQVKLYDVLTKKHFSRVGDAQRIDCRCRIIIGSKENSKQKELENCFNDNLRDYLIPFSIRLYPLREHKSDIVMLANQFVFEFSLNEKSQIKRITNDAIDELLAYHWPGNIRELEAIVRLAFVISESNEIRKQDIRIYKESIPSPNWRFGKKTLKEFNREIIESYLAEFDNDLETVSHQLKIGKSTLYRMIKNKEIERK